MDFSEWVHDVRILVPHVSAHHKALTTEEILNNQMGRKTSTANVSCPLSQNHY